MGVLARGDKPLTAATAGRLMYWCRQVHAARFAVDANDVDAATTSLSNLSAHCLRERPGTERKDVVSDGCQRESTFHDADTLQVIDQAYSRKTMWGTTLKSDEPKTVVTRKPPVIGVVATAAAATTPAPTAMTGRRHHHRRKEDGKFTSGFESHGHQTTTGL